MPGKFKNVHVVGVVRGERKVGNEIRDVTGKEASGQCLLTLKKNKFKVA